MVKRIGFFVLGILFFVNIAQVYAQGNQASIAVLDRNGQEVSAFIDGNNIQLSIKLPASAISASDVVFSMDGLALPGASCTVAVGSNTCTSPLFTTLGWFWNAQGVAQPQRKIQVTVSGQPLPIAKVVTLRPRPVVMVHGFISSWETWKAYLGSQGYLASVGLQGYAVGDGQFPGVLNTGNPSQPAERTNSIAQNAEILGQYIESVQQQTGAEKVDLLVHSMGGMISRYYLDRVMKNENVAQVIFLGTPMAGSACVYPLAALGYLQPGSLEILPDYMTNVFNQQIIHRHGVPFHAVAGTLLIDPLTSPCASAPSDTVVALGSATSIALDDVQEIPLFHGDLTGSKQAFEQYVVHFLQAPDGSFAPRPDLVAAGVKTQIEQFSRAYTGHLKPGETSQVTINIDPNVSLANFSLYDSSRSLVIEVRGASGKVLELDLAKNGVLKIDDPKTMVYLGYGFNQPKPGKWVVTLKTTETTPPQGSDYSIAARFIGGATLSASSSVTIPTSGQAVVINAHLQLDGLKLAVSDARAIIRDPAGAQETLTLAARDDGYSVEYLPKTIGLHSVEVILTGKTADGFDVDRAAFLAFEVQPTNAAIDSARFLAVAWGLGLLILLIALFWLIGFLRRRSKGAAV